MKIIPVITEKSTEIAKKGKYTFWFGVNSTKAEIKKALKDIFDVDVLKVKTQTYRARTKVNVQGKKQGIKGRKKAIVTVKEGQRIDIFDIKESKK